MQPRFISLVHWSHSCWYKSRAISQASSMGLGEASSNGWSLHTPASARQPRHSCKPQRGGQGICNAGLSCTFLPAQDAPPRGANSSSMGEHMSNRQLGARLYWLSRIVPLNYPLTPLTLWGAVGPHKSQLLLLPLLFFFFLNRFSYGFLNLFFFSHSN